MSTTEPIWVLFTVPTPTPTRGESARDLFDKRARWITEEMRASATSLGCTFHRCWYAADGSAFYAIACWQTREGANAFFERWSIADEEGEKAVRLEETWAWCLSEAADDERISWAGDRFRGRPSLDTSPA